MLLFYAAVFLTALFLRRYFFSGRYLSVRQDSQGRRFLSYSLPLHLPFARKKRRFCSLGLLVQSQEPFVIKKERWLDAKLKKNHLASEVWTGNWVIDKTLFFANQPSDVLQTVFSNEAVLQALKHLFSEGGVRGVYCFNGKLWCTYSLTFKPMDNDKLHRLEDLQTLAGALDSVSQPRTAVSTRSPARSAVLFMSVHAGLLALVIFALLPFFLDSTLLLNPDRFYRCGLVIACFLLLGWFTGMMIVFKGTAWLPMVCSDFILFGIVGLVFASLLTLREINIEWDNHPPTPLLKSVLAKECFLICSTRRGRATHTSTHTLDALQCATFQSRQVALSNIMSQDSACNACSTFKFRLTLPPFMPEQPQAFKLTTNDEVFDQVQVGSLMSITLYPGALHFPWFDIKQIKSVPWHDYRNSAWPYWQ